MHVKICYGDKPVYLCNALDSNIEELLHHPDVVYIDELSSAAVNSMTHEIKKEEFHAGVIKHEDLEALKKEFFRHFTIIDAAGGIVQNEKKELLFIFRRGKWDLPKGKLEKNEDPATGALRETEEETGVKNLKLKKEIGTTYHIYDEFGKHILKRTVWFLFTCKSVQELTPQLDEDITEVKWISTKEIKKPMSNTYATIRDILTVYFDTP